MTVCVDAEADSADPKMDLLRFKVVDTGCGMDEELKTRLFQPFEMAHPSRISKRAPARTCPGACPHRPGA